MIFDELSSAAGRMSLGAELEGSGGQTPFSRSWKSRSPSGTYTIFYHKITSARGHEMTIGHGSSRSRFCLPYYFLYTSKTPFGRRTSERESEPCTCRRVRGYFQLACARHPPSRSLAVCQIWKQSTRPFLRSGSGILHVHTCKLGPK